VTVRCSIACRARATAVARVRGRRVELRSRFRSAEGGRAMTLRIRVPRALAGRRLRIAVTATDRSGRTLAEHRTVRLRRR
jgi:hypothetical protein